MATTSKKNYQSETKKQQAFSFAFGRINYILMGIGLVLLAIGYSLLSGGGSEDPNVFNPDMFDARRLVVSPIMIVLGFIFEIVAIMVKPCSKNEEHTQE